MKFKPQVLGPTIVAAAGVAMLIWTWRTWTDPIVDFGRECYVPWQLSEGKVLYRDIVSYFNGPLSPYLHALLFRIFGASLRTLMIFNVGLIAVLTAMLFRLIARSAGRLAATTACVAFLVLFAFAQHVVTGNYNFVTPYSYELTHGITLTVAAITCLVESLRSGRRIWTGATGAIVGLVLLTKAEVALAAVLATLCGVIAVSWIRRARPGRLVADLAVFVGCAAGVCTIAVALLMLRLPTSDAVKGILGAWRWVGDRTLLNLPYFQQLAGTDDVSASALRMLGWWAAYLVVLGLPIVLGKFIRKPGAPGAVFVVMILIGWWMRGFIRWEHFIAPLPILLALAAIAFAVRVIKRHGGSVLPLVLCVWALALLAKMPLNPHIYHYGFALAMPATIVTLALLLGWLPAWLDRFAVAAHLRAATLAGLALATLVYAGRTHEFISTKTVWMGAGGDAYRADARGEVVNEVLAELKRIAPRGGTLAVVPEGLIINYLARMENPTGQLNLTPPAIIMYGEDEMIRAFQSHPPDFIVLTGVDTAEYGARFFGDDYARQLGAWMQENYTVHRVIGARPFRDEGFGLVILRKSASAS